MKKVKYKILSQTLALGIFAFSCELATAEASTTMPYFGPDQKQCKVNHPSAPMDSIDGGYVTSEDCSFVYILPPKFGILEYSEPSYALETSGCTQIAKNVSSFFDLDPVTHQANPNMGPELQAYMDILREINPDQAALFSGSASFQWEQLLKAYQDANPPSWLSSFMVPPVTFVRMPIAIGALNLWVAKKDQGVMSGGLNNSDTSVTPLGATFPSTGSVSGLALYEELFKQSKSFIMGDALGVEIGLSLPAACQYKSSLKDPSIAGTYTYVYPVQTKGLLRITLKTGAIQNEVHDFILNSRDGFKPADLYQLVKDRNIFNIELNEGAFSGVEPKMLTDYKDLLMKMTTEGLLTALRNSFERSKADSTTVHFWDNYKTECSSFLFWDKCSTIHWVSNTQDIDWEKVAREVSQNLGSFSAETSQYKTFYRISTSAFKDAGAVR